MWDPFTPTMLAAGALLSVLRQRSGSLAAPVLLHLAANCTALLASALARTLTERQCAAQIPPSTGMTAPVT